VLRGAKERSAQFVEITTAEILLPRLRDQDDSVLGLSRSLLGFFLSADHHLKTIAGSPISAHARDSQLLDSHQLSTLASWLSTPTGGDAER